MNQWQLEEMACSGTPLQVGELLQALAAAVATLEVDIAEADDPFSSVGAFH